MKRDVHAIRGALCLVLLVLGFLATSSGPTGMLVGALAAVLVIGLVIVV